MKVDGSGVRTVLTLRTRPERVQKVLEFYKGEEVLEESLRLTRAISSEIAYAIDGSGEIIVTAEWPDDEAYQEWVSHPVRAEIGVGLTEVLGGDVSVGTVYRVDHGVRKE